MLTGRRHLAVTTSPTSSPRAAGVGFPRVQVLRALAALAVVGVHLTARSHEYAHRTLWHDQLEFGTSGVDVFFVISGFILCTVHRADVGHLDRLRGFATKRVVRVFPLYWLVTLVLLPVYLGGYGDDSKRSLSVIARSLVLLPQQPGVFPIVNVGWTLTFELFFYAMFAVLIALPRRPAQLVWLAWLVPATALAIAEIAGNQHPLRGHIWADLVLSARSLEFLLGCLVGLAVAHRRVPSPGWVLSAGVLLYLLIGVDPAGWNLADRSVLAYGLPAALMVAGAAALDRSGVRYRGPTWAVRLGDASYALYLIHFSLLVAAFRLIGHGPALPAGLFETVVVAVLVVVCVIAVAVHVRLERPLIQWLRHRLLSQEDDRRLAASPGEAALPPSPSVGAEDPR
ncbi:MAG: acyltransferase 3 [Frankiales bacterium]|nr:acyltransferase 3 [Frankiales bacterium]